MNQMVQEQKAAQRLAVQPPGRIWVNRSNLDPFYDILKTAAALAPGRRPGRLQPRVGPPTPQMITCPNNYSSFFLPIDSVSLCKFRPAWLYCRVPNTNEDNKSWYNTRQS